MVGGHNKIGKGVPQDVEGERAVICAIIQGADPDVEPALILDCDRRALLIAADTLRAEGWDQWPQPVDDTQLAMRDAVKARAQRIAHAVLQAGTWLRVDPPAQELFKCLQYETPGNLRDVDHYVQRVRDAWLKREGLIFCEELSAACRRPSADLSHLLNGRLDELREGMPRANCFRSRRPIERFTFGELRENHQVLNVPIIDGLIRECETENDVATSKSGKSWFQYAKLLSIVTGRPWLGRFEVRKGMAAERARIGPELTPN